MSNTGKVTVSCQGVSRWFGLLVAVSDVNFEIGPGITALLGPNGAGKSTLLRMLSGTLLPSRGRVEILGGNPRTQQHVRAQIGLVPQQDALFDHMTAAAMLRSIAALTHLPKPATAAAAALELVDLNPADKRTVSQYSKGMRQRVKLAAALIHKPKVLLADEPLAGLDPVQRRGVIALFRQLSDEGVTVLLSSHVLDEVARFGSDIVVIHQGRLAATGDFHSLRQQLNDRPHRSTVLTNRPRQLAAALMQIPGVIGVSLVSPTRATVYGAAAGAGGASGEAGASADAATGGAAAEGDLILAVDVRDPDAFGRAVAPVAREVGATLRAVNQTDDDLESVFRYLVERK